jgi:hypothetical protein
MQAETRLTYSPSEVYNFPQKSARLHSMEVRFPIAFEEGFYPIENKSNCGHILANGSSVAIGFLADSNNLGKENGENMKKQRGPVMAKKSRVQMTLATATSFLIILLLGIFSKVCLIQFFSVFWCIILAIQWGFLVYPGKSKI